MRLFRVRKAKNVPANVREICERLGSDLIAHVVAAGDYGPRYEALRPLSVDLRNHEHVLAWLTEQYDRAERKENWSLIMEIAITLFVLAELLFAVYDHRQWIIALPHRIATLFQ